MNSNMIVRFFVLLEQNYRGEFVCKFNSNTLEMKGICINLQKVKKKIDGLSVSYQTN